MSTETLVVKMSDPDGMTGKVIGASEDGSKLAVLWSDNVTRVELASEVFPAEAAL